MRKKSNQPKAETPLRGKELMKNTLDFFESLGIPCNDTTEDHLGEKSIIISSKPSKDSENDDSLKNLPKS